MYNDENINEDNTNTENNKNSYHLVSVYSVSGTAICINSYNPQNTTRVDATIIPLVGSCCPNSHN